MCKFSPRDPLKRGVAKLSSGLRTVKFVWLAASRSAFYATRLFGVTPCQFLREFLGLMADERKNNVTKQDQCRVDDGPKEFHRPMVGVSETFSKTSSYAQHASRAMDSCSRRTLTCLSFDWQGAQDTGMKSENMLPNSLALSNTPETFAGQPLAHELAAMADLLLDIYLSKRASRGPRNACGQRSVDELNERP